MTAKKEKDELLDVLVETLIAISVVTKSLAKKVLMQTLDEKEVKQDEK